MKLMNQWAILAFAGLLLSSCVSKKEFTSLKGRYDQLELEKERMAGQLDNCNNERDRLRSELATRSDQLSRTQAELDLEKRRNQSLEEQVDYFKDNNSSLLDQLSNLSVINKTGAESIKKSLEAIRSQNSYIQDLNSSIQRKDSVALALVMNLKRSLSDVNDEDVQIEVKKGVVYISLSDKMLFKSGSAEINSGAAEVLGKIAKVVNDHRELDILVEGHTDNVPIKTDCMKDNWDLSSARATAVIRVLQWRHGVAPERMTAGGRAQYVPKADNDTKAGRSLNRRTEILILPKLDQFFKLLEAPAGE
ncbi:MAG: OmpA family protein [Saprospiraceae bacterium]|nr:OmpA family protein [Saprospiraceae bacterium]